MSDWILLFLSYQEKVIGPECLSVLTKSLCTNWILYTILFKPATSWIAFHYVLPYKTVLRLREQRKWPAAVTGTWSFASFHVHWQTDSLKAQSLWHGCRELNPGFCEGEQSNTCSFPRCPGIILSIKYEKIMRMLTVSFFCPKSTEHIYVYCDNERSLSSLVRLFIDMQIKWGEKY